MANWRDLLTLGRALTAQAKGAVAAGQALAAAVEKPVEVVEQIEVNVPQIVQPGESAT